MRRLAIVIRYTFKSIRQFIIKLFTDKVENTLVWSFIIGGASWRNIDGYLLNPTQISQQFIDIFNFVSSLLLPISVFTFIISLFFNIKKIRQQRIIS